MRKQTERGKTKQEQDIYRVEQRASGRAELVSQRGKSMVVMMKCVQFLSEAGAEKILQSDTAGLVWMEGQNGKE